MTEKQTLLHKEDFIRVHFNDGKSIVYVFSFYKGVTQRFVDYDYVKHVVAIPAYGLHVQEIHTHNEVIVDVKPKYNFGYICSKPSHINRALLELKKCTGMDSIRDVVHSLRRTLSAQMKNDAMIELNRKHRLQRKGNPPDNPDSLDTNNPKVWLKKLEEWQKLYRE